jgi:hypothetical protein
MEVSVFFLKKISMQQIKTELGPVLLGLTLGLDLIVDFVQLANLQ